MAMVAALLLLLAAGPTDARKKKPAPRPARKPAAAAKGPRTPAAPPPSDPAAVAALGEAYTAYRAGDHAGALALAAPLVDATLRNRDYALYVAAQAAFLVGDRDRALALFKKLAAAPASRFRHVAAWRVADCVWELGRHAEARRLYGKLLGTPDGEDAVGLYRIGESHARAGDATAAVVTWRRLALEWPWHPLADRAIARMAEVNGATLSARDRIARAATLTGSRYWTEALAELALVGDDHPEEVLHLRDYWIGTTLFKMRRQYARAGELLIGVHDKFSGGRAAEALFHGARGLSRADRDDDAIRWYKEVVRKYPSTSYAEEAQYLVGWLEFNRGRFREAIPGLEQLLRRYPRSKWADDGQWYLAFSHYLLGDYAQALPLLEKVAARDGELDGGKGRYWKARTLIAMGRVDDGVREMRALVGRYPLSWYAILARARLAERGIAIGPFGDHDSAPSRRAPEFGGVDESLAADPLVVRVDELIAAGLGVEAGVELYRGERAFIERHGRARALPILMDRYRKAGNYNRPWMLAEVYGGGASRVPPDGDARPWWEHAYPLAYRELVEKYQGLGDNPPYYLYAIMRKESGYNPHIVSYADAIGLMQMIPPTTRRVAPILGMVYTDDLLYDPELNVKVASWYIGNLVKKFKHQIPIAAGSYNAGPRSAMRWLDRWGDRPMDEFVELVGSLAREYMKKVTGVYARYQLLYEGVDYQQTLVVDREYLRNDLDY